MDIRIIKNVGTISSNETGMQKELNIVSKDGGQFEYDIREWSLDHGTFGEGITIENEEAKLLLAYLKECFKDGDEICIDNIPILPQPQKESGTARTTIEVDERIYLLLKDKNIEYIDKRANGGALWVIGGHELDSLMEEFKASGYKFEFSQKGGRQTKGQPGWFLRNVKHESSC